MGPVLGFRTGNNPPQSSNNPSILKTALLAASILGLGLSAITGSFLLLGISIAVLGGFFIADCTGTTPAVLGPVYNVFPRTFFVDGVRPVINPFMSIPPASYLHRRVTSSGRHRIDP